MPTTETALNRVFRRNTQLAVLLAVSLVTIAALIVALFSVQKSGRTAACVNTNLGDRARATQIESDARYASTLADLQYLTKQGSKTNAVEKKQAYVVAQKQATAYRAAHPAGRC